MNLTAALRLLRLRRPLTRTPARFDALLSAETHRTIDPDVAAELTTAGLLRDGELTPAGTATLAEWCHAVTGQFVLTATDHSADA